MEDVKWKMEYGRCKMEDGGCKKGNGGGRDLQLADLNRPLLQFSISSCIIIQFAKSLNKCRVTIGGGICN